MNINDDLYEVINRNLPSLVAGELLKYLKDSKDLQDKCYKQKVELRLLQERIGKQKDLLDERDREIARLEDLSNREKDVIDREIRLEITLLKEKLDNKTTSNNELYRLVEKVFGHPSVTVTKTDSKSVVLPGSDSSPSMTNIVTDYSNETSTNGKV